MKKQFTGKVVSTKQQKTAVVEMVRKVTHPLYRKLLTKMKKVQVDTGEFSVKMGDQVVIEETRPISKTKNFKIVEVKK